MEVEDPSKWTMDHESRIMPIAPKADWWWFFIIVRKFSGHIFVITKTLGDF